MILKKNFHPLKVWQYIKVPMTFSILWSIAVWVLYFLSGYKALALNFTPIGVLGSALAIFVAFRNNSAYARWWEARTLWGGIVNSSRIFARLIISFTDSHAHQPQYQKARSESFKKEMIYKCIAWAHALRLHLRHENSWDELKAFLSDEEFEQVSISQNKPNILQLLIGKQIYNAMANGTLGGFDSFQLEGQLAAFSNYQGACERIKNTPLPRQYDFFTRVFIYLFTALLPFGLLSFFSADYLIYHSWIIIPVSIILSGVFVIMERTGAANEAPFENLITDIPMSAMCNGIERDLLEMLGEKDLPLKKEAVNGYLY